MPEVLIEVEVFCAECGDGLCNQTESKTRYPDVQGFHVAPCKACLRVARDEGYDEGQANFAVDGE